MGYQTTSLGPHWCGWTYACWTLFTVLLYLYLYWWFLWLCPCCIHLHQGCSSTAFPQHGFLGEDLYWSLAHLCLFWPRRGIFRLRPTIILLIQRYHSLDLHSPHSSTEWSCREIQLYPAWESRSHVATCLFAKVFLAGCCWDFTAYL